MRKKKNTHTLGYLYASRDANGKYLLICGLIMLGSLIFGIFFSINSFYNLTWAFCGYFLCFTSGLSEALCLFFYIKIVKLIKRIESELSEEERANIEKMNEIDFRDYQ